MNSLPTQPLTPSFPTPLHQEAAQAAYDFFRAQPAVDTILVVNSCARGQAAPASDLDMAVLARPGTPEAEIARLEGLWKRESAQHARLNKYLRTGPFAHLHLDVITGQYSRRVWDDGGGPDYFEVEIGNQVAYAAPLGQPGAYYRRLQAEWLPYYAAGLRRERLAMVRAACAYDLSHVAFFVERALYFQAFDRLYKAFQEFLQALFIARQVYPLAYNKWIRMQIADWLDLPGLYPALPPILSVSRLESAELVDKAAALGRLLDQWAVEG